jgi:hypothetical protein
LFGAFKHAIAALDDRTAAHLARRARAAWGLGLAIRRATVAILLVAVVACFVVGGLDDAVTAACGGFARRAWDRAHVSALKLAIAVAAIAFVGIAVVAIFAWFNALVPTLRDAGTQLSGRALEGRVLNCAGGITAVVVLGIAVVTHLACPNSAIATNDIFRAFAFFGAGPVVLDLAITIAAVARCHIAVVAFFNAVLVVNTVAAAGW